VAAQPTVDGQFSVTFPEGVYERLYAHLFRPDRDEHGAVIAAGVADTAAGPRLLVRDLFLAVDGKDYVHGQRGYRMLTADFVRDAALYCRDEKLSYLAVHNHGGTDAVAFSGDDLASHERGYPALVQLLRGRPVGALVLATNAVAGDLFSTDGKRRTLSAATVIGRSRLLQYPEPHTSTRARNARYQRQSLLFGAEGQRLLQQLRVGIIGAGGVGSLLIEYLARLGVGGLVVADPDVLEETNLPRVVGARIGDIKPPRKVLWRFSRRSTEPPSAKVSIAKRMALEANADCNVEAIRDDFLNPDVARRFVGCDYLFLAADSMRCRLLYNAICHQYLIPGAQVGSKVTIDKATGKLLTVFSVVRPVRLDGGCLWCNGLIPSAALQQEAATQTESRQQRYVNDPAVIAPSVVTLNAVGAAHAANEFLFRMLSLRPTTADDGDLAYFRSDSLSGAVFIDEPRVDEDCTECGLTSRSRRARGDSALLPTRA
jgi:hypothetical protein